MPSSVTKEITAKICKTSDYKTKRVKTGVSRDLLLAEEGWLGSKWLT